MEMKKFVPIKLQPTDGLISIKEAVLESVLNGKPEDLKDQILVMRGQFTEGRGRDKPIVPASWLPNELKSWCFDPQNVAIPKTITKVALTRPMDMAKIAKGDPKGQCILGFESEVPQAVGSPRKRIYFTSYELISAENALDAGIATPNVNSFEATCLEICG